MTRVDDSALDGASLQKEGRRHRQRSSARMHPTCRSPAQHSGTQQPCASFVSVSVGWLMSDVGRPVCVCVSGAGPGTNFVSDLTWSITFRRLSVTHRNLAPAPHRTRQERGNDNIFLQYRGTAEAVHTVFVQLRVYTRQC